MAEKIVKLSQRYEAHGETFDSVTVREPRFADLMDLGEPYELQKTGGGMPVVIENTPAIAAYVRRCVIKPGAEQLGELGVVDSRAVRTAVLDFFTRGGSVESKLPTTSGSELTT